ncbi:Na/Pi cotransporter family protein [Thioclava sp.]|uniref:Na/Pi cotransporter family protein n=1 Tax=Thioclava sp. TaxID=1933450 RepID=UPI003AA8F050
MTLDLDKFALFTGLFGGLALFLFGMDLLTNGLKRAAGDRLKDLLGKVTSNRFFGAGMGAVVTALVNSSSVTTVILVGFISAGLMSMAQSVSVIMGANIGSTMTAQILAFNVTRYALPMITLGFLVSYLPGNRNRQDYGRMLLGIGLVFYGMGVMSEAMIPLRSEPAFINFIATLSNPLLAVLTGMVFTAIIQSSAATTGIVIVLAGQGIVTLETAIAVAMGANIGTCATAGLAAIGKPREAVRAAIVHVLFNVLGVLVWILLIDQMAEIARYISPQGDVPRQVANAHTIFNVANTFLFIGFTTQIARFVEWLVPDRPLSTELVLAPKYLDASLISTPTFALENVRREIGRLGEHVTDMLNKSLPASLSGSKAQLEALSAMDKPVDDLHRAILEYLGEVSRSRLSDEQSRDLMQLVTVANDLEHIADVVAEDIVTSTRKRMEEHAGISPYTAKRITDYHAQIARALEGAVRSVFTQDIELAEAVRGMKHDVVEMSRYISRTRFERLKSSDGAINRYVREVELLELLDGIFRTARRIARSQLERAEVEPAI